MGALASFTFAALASSAANHVALTNNSAGYGDLLDSLARQQGQQASSLAQQNQLAFANQSKQDQLAALQGLSGLYGTNSSLLGGAMGIPGQLLGVDANVSKTPSFGSSVLIALGGSLGKLVLIRSCSKQALLRLIFNMNPYWLMVAFALLRRNSSFLCAGCHRRMRDVQKSRAFSYLCTTSPPVICLTSIKRYS